MIKIESVQVIPSRKDSIFEDDFVEETFECYSFTTSYQNWLGEFSEHDYQYNFDLSCREFAKRQNIFMTGPTAKFGKTVYVAKSLQTKSLEDFPINGPLYRVYKIKVWKDTKKQIFEEILENSENVIGEKEEVYLVRYGVETII
jgi:hypothetical protein